MWIHAMEAHFNKVGEEPMSKWGFAATGKQRFQFWEDWCLENITIPDLYEDSYGEYYEELAAAEEKAREDAAFLESLKTWTHEDCQGWLNHFGIGRR